MTLPQKPAILVVEDDPALAKTVLTLLEAEGYPVEDAPSSAEAFEKLGAGKFPIVISDIYLDERSGLDILRRAKALDPDCAVILITGKGSLDTVLEASRAGAFDYLAKPFALDQLMNSVRNAESAWREAMNPAAAPVDSSAASLAHHAAQRLIGNSTAMVETYKFISRVADADTTVLLEGETGTGKELMARMIHESGARRERRFAVVDCGALPPTLLEAELFGSVRGAFTGADRDRSGLLDSADGGTAFLDEIGEIDPAFQLRLLRFLQEREVRPVGSSTSRKVDVRIIAATNRDLRRLVAEKKFREDLWYRLNVAALRLAPLRERSADITLLIDYFLEACRGRLGRAIRLSDGARKLAAEHSWPGNIRQLQNTLERLAILHTGPVVETAAFRQAIGALEARNESSAADSLEDAEAEHIRKVLAAAHGNKTRAAEILGIERKTLYRKLERMRDKPQ